MLFYTAGIHNVQTVLEFLHFDQLIFYLFLHLADILCHIVAVISLLILSSSCANV